MGRQVPACVAMLFAATVSSAATAAAELRILYAEPVELAVDDTAIGAQKPGGASALSLLAYGRQLDLVLQSNERVLGAMPLSQREKLAGHRLYRGALAGLQGSWVRLTRSRDDYFGVIWDGAEMYTIAPSHMVRPFLTSPAIAAPAATYIYRWSDARSGIQGASCAVAAATSGSGGTALEQMQVLSQELRSNPDVAAAAALTGQIDVALIGDYEFSTLYGQSSEGVLLASLNIVDGIFSEQVGITIAARELIVFRTAADPFSTSGAESLLDQLAAYRYDTPAVRAPALAHLVTGRDLDQNVVGIAYLDALCEPRQGVSLSQGTFDSVSSALILAHEIGHNFGAPHDGQAGSVCAATSLGYLMSPTVNGSSTFSACSLAQMQPPIAAASCIVPPTIADTSVLDTPATFNAVVGQPFQFPVQVTSVGTALARDVQLNVQLPYPVVIQSVSAASGTCAISGRLVTCQLGEMAPGESRQILVTGSAAFITSAAAMVQVSAATDRNLANNTRTVQMNFVAAADAAVAVQPAQLTGMTRTPIDFTVAVSSVGVEPIETATVEVFIAGQPITAASVEGVACTIEADRAVCALGRLEPVTGRNVQLQIVATQAGLRSGRARVLAEGDGNLANNTADFLMNLTPAQDVELQMVASQQRQQVGAPFSTTLLALSTGPQNLSDVRIRLSSTGLIVESALPSQGACTPQGADFVCDLGGLAGGASNSIQVVARASMVGTHVLSARLESGDDLASNDSASSWVEARYSSDIAVQSYSQYGWEGEALRIEFSPRSVGMSAAQNVRVTVLVPDGLTVMSAQLGNIPCEVAGQTVTCVRSSLDPDHYESGAVTVMATQAGTYAAAVTVSSSNDANAANDSAVATLQVQPSAPLNVSAPAAPTNVVVDETFELVYAVAVGHRLVSDIGFRWGSDGRTTVESAVSSAGSCSINGSAVQCGLGSLAPNSRTEVTLRLKVASSGSYWSSAYLNFTSSYPVRGQTSAYLTWSARRQGDAAVTVAAASINALTGRSVDFPAVTVRGLRTLDEAQLDISFNRPGVIVQTYSVDGAGYCFNVDNGLRCSLGTVLADSVRTFRATISSSAAGVFNSSIQLTSYGDTDPANDTASVSVVVDAPPSPVPPPATGGGGGGGGGGRMDPIFLLIGLMALALRRGRPRAELRPTVAG